MFENFRDKFPIADDKWSEYINCFKRIDVAAKTVLLHEGEISKKVFLVEKGCVRAWFNNNGKDITFQFFFENSTVSSIESFRKKSPSLINIETIEPSVIWYAHKKDIDRMIETISENNALRTQFINVLFDRMFNYMQHFFSFIKDTPQQRYINLINEKPEIVKRVPQHYIASYLGISTVHLSRLKNKLAKKKSI